MAPQNDDPLTTPPANPSPTPTPPTNPPEQPAQPPAFTPSATPVPSAFHEQPSPFPPIESQTTSPFTAAPEPGGLTPLKPKSSRKKLIAIIIAAVVAVLGIGTYVAYAYWFNNPQNVVADSLSKIATMKTGAAQGFFETSSDESKLRANFNFAQASQREGSLTGDINITGGGETYTVKASLVTDKENKAYIKLENIGKLLGAFMGFGVSPEYVSLFDGLVAKIDNKWVVLTPKDLAGGDEKANAQSECTTKALETFSDDKKQQDEVFAAYRKNPFVVAKQVGVESVNGAASNHYEITLDKQKARDFLKAAKETAFYKAIDKCEEGEFNKSFDESAVDDFVSGTSKSKIELWVDQWSHNPTKLKVSVDESGTKLTSEVTIDLNAKPSVTVPKADTTFDDITAEFQKIQDQILGDLSASVESEDMEQPVLGMQTFLPSFMRL